MAKKRKVSKAPSKTKNTLYKPATYGIQFDSMTFLVLAVFVLVVAVLLVAQMAGVKIF